MDLERIKLKENSSIKQALKIIGNERVRLGLIVDDDDKFFDDFFDD